MNITIYLKAAAALAAMGTVSFMVFDGLLGKQFDQREPVAASALAEGGADYLHGTDPVGTLDAPVVLQRAVLKATPFANSYRITEDVAGRVYKNGVDLEGEVRLAQVDGVWKSLSNIRASRQLPPDTWKPAPIAPPTDAARCPAGVDADPLVGAVHFLHGGARALATLPPPLKAGGVIAGCIELGARLPLSAPNPVMTTATLKGQVIHRGRPALLFDVSGKGVEAYGGYALVDAATGLVVFSDIQAKIRDGAAHGGYGAEIRELARVDLR